LGGSIADQARQLARRVSANTGIPADLIFAQWAHETGGFTNRGTTQLNNLAGIRYAGSTEYRKFDSTEDFADFYGKLIESKRYTSKGINDAKTPEAFAHALKAGSYYEGPEDVYARQMRAWEPKFAGPSGSSGPAQISVGSIPITITHPGATHEQIQVAVTNGVRDGLGQQTQTNMTNVAGIYQ
jgi:flagellum-specific peptidoglycan hydrolase FlgJ